MFFKKIIRIIKFLAVFLLAVAALIFLAVSLPKRSPIKGFIVTSGSMRPKVLAGSVVFVKRGNRDLQKNDVITFLKPDNPQENVTHRIVEVEKKKDQTYFITKGDANNALDLWKVRKESVWGKVIFQIPLIGFISVFAGTRLGSIVVFVIPALIIVISEIISIRRELLRLKLKKSQRSAVTVGIILILFLPALLNLNPSPSFSRAGFLAMRHSSDNVITSSCWQAPSIPVLVYPPDNYFAGLGSAWDLNPYMDWADSTTTCPLSTTITYQYESYSDPGLTSLLYQSGWLSASQIPAPGTPDGIYYWRVRARDNHGNTGAFSGAWKLTVDRSIPSTPSLSITGSYTKAVEEKISNGGFDSGDLTGWTTAGSVSVGSSASNFYAIIGNEVDPGNYLWENRLMQSFATGAKSLSLQYNFFSRDYSPFDQPGFQVRLGGQEIFRLNNLESDGGTIKSTGWREFIYDLSSQNNSQTNLAIYAGNTGDKESQSWAYVDQVTTYFVSAPLHATYSFSASEPDINRYEYNLDDTGWTVVAVGATFTLPSGNHTLQYRSIDNAENHSPIVTVQIIVDDNPPSAITDLAATPVSANQIALTWTSPGNDGATGRAATYDLRYSTSPIDPGNFDSATKVDHLPSPQSVGASESFEITGLNPATTYYFALKSADEAPNWSPISNLPSAATAAGLTINPGDIVINEILWVSGANPEQLIELRNITDRLFPDLSSLDLKLGGVTIVNFSGSTLAPHGYLLLSTLNGATSNLLPTVAIDIPDAVFNLPRDVLDLTLEDGAVLIDTAWTTAEPVTEGVYDTTPGAQNFYSLERVSSPGAGDNPLNWYTCIDSASSAEFFDSVPGVDFRATPRAVNRSENEPLSHLRLLRLTPTPTPTLPAPPTPIPSPTPSPSLTVNLSPLDSANKIKLELSFLPLDFFADYEVKYTNSAGEQGFAGTFNSPDIIDNKIIREFYLGTCSAGGACVPDTGIGSTATVNLFGPAVDFNQAFIIQ